MVQPEGQTVTDHDVIVVKDPDESAGGRVGPAFAEQFPVARAKADGVDLVGPGGLLAGLTNRS